MALLSSSVFFFLIRFKKVKYFFVRKIFHYLTWPVFMVGLSLDKVGRLC